MYVPHGGLGDPLSTASRKGFHFNPTTETKIFTNDIVRYGHRMDLSTRTKSRGGGMPTTTTTNPMTLSMRTEKV